MTEREQAILRVVVQQFIQTAAPVGSKSLAEEHVLNLSSASIRAILNRLEALGYLDHPHTSAGRVPTDLGYRTYVDDLMDVTSLSTEDAVLVRGRLEQAFGDVEGLLRDTSRLLGRLTNLLGVVLTPRIATGVLERLEMVPLSSDRVLFVLSVQGGLVRTIMLDVDMEVPRDELYRIVALLNERLAGLTLDEIRRTCAERVQDLDAEDRTGIVRLVMREADQVFRGDREARRAQLAGAKRLIAQPEFREPEEVRRLIELVESEEVVVHLLEAGANRVSDAAAQAVVLIGKEIATPDETPSNYAIVTAPYRFGSTVGAVGVIGPMRMDYVRVVSVVEHVAEMLSRSDRLRA